VDPDGNEFLLHTKWISITDISKETSWAKPTPIHRNGRLYRFRQENQMGCFQEIRPPFTENPGEPKAERL
jgi:hypothetical protein